MPGLIANIRDPIAPNQPVDWSRGPAAAPEGERPPNIVVIVADDLGFNDISLHSGVGGGAGGGGGAGDGGAGGTDGGGDGGGDGWSALEGVQVFGVPNLDDDDDNRQQDWGDRGPAGDDDLSSLALPALEAGQRLDLALAGDTDALRIWRDGAVLLDQASPEASLEGPLDDLLLQVEFGDLRAQGTLSLALRDGGAAAGEWTLDLVGAPLILNHHLQAGELEQAMAYDGRDGNTAFTSGFADELGAAFETYELTRYDWDVWIQDEIEHGTLTAPGLRIDVVLDSIRSQRGDYLDGLVDEMGGPGEAVLGYGSGYATSQDSFGNLEVSPPVTVDGVSYPYGRIYWGASRSSRPHAALREMLEAQEVQAPFELDVSWLCVGHVDEFLTFLPDPDSDKGFVMWVADTTLGWEALEALDPDMEIPQYRTTHGYRTIGQILADTALLRVNEDVQAEGIDPNVERMMEHLGLEESDIVRVPALFEEYPGCGGATLSLVPGTINMTVWPADEGVLAFLPDPFLRADVEDRSTDSFIPLIEALLPRDVEPVWLDDWDWYHALMGEVHCGSNTRRTPTATWWTEADHLMGGAE
ncbi:hypothetical protein L6R53_14875 [Myxococcota bacterium]|nr:hypothetical protein [Myxococcota bacterium]